MRAVLAAGNVPAEGCRAAALDGTHHLQLGKAHVAAVGLTPSGTVVAEDPRPPEQDGPRALRSKMLSKQHPVDARMLPLLLDHLTLRNLAVPQALV